MPIADAATRLATELLFVARDSTASGDQPDDIAGFTPEHKAFEFSWFIPELLKHKTLWRDVLLASLAIQLVGLPTPLFTQVIIDKIVVHSTGSRGAVSRNCGVDRGRSSSAGWRRSDDRRGGLPFAQTVPLVERHIRIALDLVLVVR